MNRPHALVAAIFTVLAVGCTHKPDIAPYVSPPVGEITKNWITLSPSGRYFVFEDGTGFYPIGTSMEGSAIQYDSAFPEKEDPSFERDFETLFANMKSRGENLLRTSPEGLAAWDGNDRLEALIADGTLQFLEKPVGHYNPKYADRLHQLLALAEKHGIYLQLDLGPHWCGVSGHFELYPYHTNNGGPVTKLPELRTNATAKAAWKNRIRYMVDTFGNTNRIFAWELWNEIDIPTCGKGDARESEAWVKEMGEYLRAYELSRYGKTHPIGLGAGVGTIPYEFFFATTGTDILQSHDYSDVRLALNPVDTALQTHFYVNGFVTKSRKPYLENERAAMDLGVPFEPLVREVEHYQEMAYLASGAAGGGAPWSYPRIEKGFLRSYRAAQRKVLAGVALAGFDLKPWEATTTNAQVSTMMVSDGSTAIGWLLHNNPIDYEIDAVRVWKGLNAAPNPLDLGALKKWLRVQRASGTCSAVDESAFLNKLTLVFKEHLGDQRGPADATSYSGNPQGYLWFGSYKTLTGAQRQRFVDDVLALLQELKLDLERAEAGCQSLDALYRNHPQVSTAITVGNLSDQRHEVVWYDDATGDELARETLTGSAITFASPQFRRCITFVIRPRQP